MQAPIAWGEVGWDHPTNPIVVHNSSGGLNLQGDLMNTFRSAISQGLRILVQNTQGAKSRDFLRMVKDYVRMQRPQIIVLLETHVSGPRADDVCNNIGFRGQQRVEAWDYQGGIWILWLEDVIQVHISEAHKQFVTTKISPRGGGVGYLQQYMLMLIPQLVTSFGMNWREGHRGPIDLG